MKKLLCVISIILCVVFLFVACDNTTEKETLSSPKGLKVSETGLITWNAVENASGYIVTINGVKNEVTETQYQGNSSESFTFSVVATAEGYNNSPSTMTLTYTPSSTIIPDDPIIPTPNLDGVTVAIKGTSEVRSGKTVTLTANVSGAEDTSVTWAIIEGGAFATVDENGIVTANEVSGDKTIIVTATSVANNEKSATKVMTVVARPELTQEMLDYIANQDKIAFEGYVNINIYSIGLFEKLETTYATVIKTSLDGTNWYAEYENASAGIKSALYYKSHNGLACQVSVSFMNEESYTPMVENDKEVKWADSGLYNNFVGLTVDDFIFDEDIWRYKYVGNDETLVQRMVASANPYDFKAKEFSLIIDDGEVVGIYALSGDHYEILEGYRAVQELFVAVGIGETVEVPTIAKYSHNEIHDDLQVALDNMHALSSYKLTFKEITKSYLSTSYVESGFTEYITEDLYYFVPFSVSYDTYGKEVHTDDLTNTYGYKKMLDGLYNSFYSTEDGGYSANRAFEGDINDAKPSFAFAPELFRTFYKDEEDGSITYYVDSVMSSVASTFYYSVGNSDVNMYGIFATEGYTSTVDSFTPFVVVKDGYIQSACFYYYLGSLYGVVELTYSDFNETEVPEGVDVDFETRNVPTSWDELTIEVSIDSSSTSEDETMNALTYLKKFFDDEEIGEKLPFFGDVLGDTYGFGMTSYRIPYGTTNAEPSIIMYYDVPLDLDYTIDSSLNAIGKYLESLGFEKNGGGEYILGDVCILPMDNSLDLIIYVWKKPKSV